MRNNQMVIGICGLISSGKDTIADYLIKEHNFRKISFADKLKDSVAAMFDWDRELRRFWQVVPIEMMDKLTHPVLVQSDKERQSA